MIKIRENTEFICLHIKPALHRTEQIISRGADLAVERCGIRGIVRTDCKIEPDMPEVDMPRQKFQRGRESCKAVLCESVGLGEAE